MWLYSALSLEVPYPLSPCVDCPTRLFPLLTAQTLPPQDPKPNSFFGSTLGAVIESYYRSSLNSWLNAKLTGKPPASMFPMFHIQIPTRVIYINGFKVTREGYVLAVGYFVLLS